MGVGKLWAALESRQTALQSAGEYGAVSDEGRSTIAPLSCMNYFLGLNSIVYRANSLRMYADFDAREIDERKTLRELRRRIKFFPELKGVKYRIVECRGKSSRIEMGAKCPLLRGRNEVKWIPKGLELPESVKRFVERVEEDSYARRVMLSRIRARKIKG